MAENSEWKDKTRGEHIEVFEEAAVLAAGDTVLVDKEGHVRKLPVPSSSPNDPLDFSYWKKAGVIVSCCWFGEYRGHCPPSPTKLMVYSIHVSCRRRLPRPHHTRLHQSLRSQRILDEHNHVDCDTSVLLHWCRQLLDFAICSRLWPPSGFPPGCCGLGCVLHWCSSQS